MVVYTNNMEVIALTTAMADARAAIQATTREIRNCRRQALHLPDQRRDVEISAILQQCDDMLSVIQVHLSYLVQNDSLLLVPGTNAEHSELRVADYWAVARLFEEILENLQQAATGTFQWDNLTQIIATSSNSLQQKYARTLAAFGVEVWSWQVNNIRLSESDRDELRDDTQSFLEDQQSSVQALTAALERAERRIIEKLEELKEEQNPL